jgi:hypothetical protein
MPLDGDFIPLQIIRDLMATDFQAHCAAIATARGEPVPAPLTEIRDDPRPFSGLSVNGPSARIGPFDLAVDDQHVESTTLSEVLLGSVVIADMTGGPDSVALANVMRIRKVALLRTFAASAVHPVYGAPPYRGVLRYKFVKSVGTPGLPKGADGAWWQAVGAQVRFTFFDTID